MSYTTDNSGPARAGTGAGAGASARDAWRPRRASAKAARVRVEGRRVHQARAAPQSRSQWKPREPASRRPRPAQSTRRPQHPSCLSARRAAEERRRAVFCSTRVEHDVERGRAYRAGADEATHRSRPGPRRAPAHAAPPERRARCPPHQSVSSEVLEHVTSPERVERAAARPRHRRPRGVSRPTQRVDDPLALPRAARHHIQVGAEKRAARKKPKGVGERAADAGENARAVADDAQSPAAPFPHERSPPPQVKAGKRATRKSPRELPPAHSRRRRARAVAEDSKIRHSVAFITDALWSLSDADRDSVWAAVEWSLGAAHDVQRRRHA